MSQATAVTERDINGFILSITTRRREGDSPRTLQDLTTNTLNAWLWMVNLLQKKEWDTAVDLPSVEEKYGTEKGINMEETFGEPRVTIWATWRSTNKFRFHLNSDDRLQNAVMVHAAQEAGIEASIAAWNKAHPSTSQQNDAPATPKNAPPPAPNTPTTPQNAANANVAPVDGVLVATTWPDKKKVQYADGQLVSYTITKIKAAFFKGSPTYELYTNFGGNYPGFTVYKFKSGTQELTQTYESIVGVLATLGLTLEQPEAIGTWRVVIKANHSEKDGVVTEYKNVQSLTAL